MKTAPLAAVAALMAMMTVGVVLAQPTGVAKTTTPPSTQTTPTPPVNTGNAVVARSKNPIPRPTSCACPGTGSCTLAPEKDGNGWNCTPTKGRGCNQRCSMKWGGKDFPKATPQ
jgi:hypothetical protein